MRSRSRSFHPGVEYMPLRIALNADITGTVLPDPTAPGSMPPPPVVVDPTAPGSIPSSGSSNLLIITPSFASGGTANVC